MDEVDRIEALATPTKQEKILGIVRGVPVNIENFILDFNKIRNQFESSLNSLTAKSDYPKEARESLDEIVQEYEELKSLVSNASNYLPSYNVKVAQNGLDSLWSQIEQKKSQLFPKKKFAFRAAAPKPVKVDVVDSIADSAQIAVQRSLNMNEERFGFRDKTDEDLVLQEDDLLSKEVYLQNLTRCVIKLFGTPSIVHMENIDQCQVYLGPVSTSVFISSARDSVFQIPCQQLRIHSTINCRFYTHITGRCIIEDSEKLTFSPYDWCYQRLSSDFAKAGLTKTVNNWRDVADFNWLVANSPSPNFTLAE